MEDKSESSNDRRFVRRIKRRKEEWRCGRSGGEAISRKRDEREEMEKRLKKKNRGVVKATTRGADEELEGDSVASPLASVLPSVAVRLISRVVCIRAKCGFFKPQFRLCATCRFGKVRPGKHVTSVLSLGSYPSPHWPSDNAHLLWSCLSEFQVWCLSGVAPVSTLRQRHRRHKQLRLPQYKIRNVMDAYAPSFASRSFCGPSNIEWSLRH